MTELKQWQYRIVIVLLWAGFLAGAGWVLFQLNPDLKFPFGRAESQSPYSDGKENRDLASGEGKESRGEEERERKDRQESRRVFGRKRMKKGRLGSWIREKEAWNQEEKPKKGKTDRFFEREEGIFGELEKNEEGNQVLEEDRKPPVLYIASDLHYQSAAATDYGKAFQRQEAESDGKVIACLPQILDAFIDEMIEKKPRAFLLTGDITMEGERINHEELAEKLSRLKEAGIPVLVIPGNHDINNYRARLHVGDEETETDMVSPQEFQDIYQDFGWNQAVSRDEASLSYIYPLEAGIWLMLLDTAQYEPQNIVDGAVRPQTLKWMEENLKIAEEQGIQVIVAGHHNLLQESSMFTDMCVLENSDAVLELLEGFSLPLYISGHLHLQRIQKHKKEPGSDEYGIYEIVSNAISIPPCQYGILSWQEDGSMSYQTSKVDVEAWAEKTGQKDQRLLEFESYQTRYITEIIQEQILKKASRLPETTAEPMAKLYAKVYQDYCAGLAIKRSEVEALEAYKSWQRYLPESQEFQELKAMIKDSMGEQNNLSF